jgi:hypothetical protein
LEAFIYRLLSKLLKKSDALPAPSGSFCLSKLLKKKRPDQRSRLEAPTLNQIKCKATSGIAPNFDDKAASEKVGRACERGR